MAAIINYTIVAPNLVCVETSTLLNLNVYKKFFRALTTIEKPQPGRPKFIACARRKAYYLNNNLVYFPRSAITGPLIKFPLHAKNNYIMPNIPRTVEIISDPPMHDYQEAVLDYVLDKLDGDICNPIYLEMGTGLGKTPTGCALSSRLGIPTLIVAPASVSIAEQWMEMYGILFPELKVAIYKNPIKDSKKPPPNFYTHDVLIIVVNTFRKKTPEFLNGCGIIIFDEVHEFQSVENSKALWLAQHVPRIVGLSATPAERADELDRYVFLHLGKPVNCAELPGFGVNAANFTGEVHVKNYSCQNPEFCAIESTAIGTLGNIIKDPVRLSLVCDEIENLSGKVLDSNTQTRHGIIVFAEHREYLIDIKNELLRRNAVESKDVELIACDSDIQENNTIDDDHLNISVLRGGIKQSVVKNAQESAAHIVLTTYGYSRRGVSIVNTTALVLATPRRSGSIQILGRAFRKGSDESICRQFIDIVDCKTNLKGQLKTRIAAYKKINLIINMH